ncbi:hypothetical protein ACFP1H_10475 [Secundilactobacillus hailunensis]|uniref:Lipoprotein n=1 Tax=Secundilactobacillus hailunensis TaxID=2559923 RepID=A0ABW1TBR9_9LACO|nr:hypothetical protein [Secundilactobacillus hailunensis]
MKLRLLRVMLVGLAGVSLVSLAGCGHSTTASKAGKVAFVTTAQNAKRQVWYRLNTAAPKSNSQVKDVLVQQKRRVTDYQVTGVSLQSLNHQRVSQVIRLAKDNERQTFNQTLASKKANYHGELATDKANQKNSNQYTYKKGIAQANSEAKQDQKRADQFDQSTRQLPFAATKAYPVTAKVSKNKSGRQVVGEIIQIKAQKWQYGTAASGTVKQVQQQTQFKLNTQDLMTAPVTVSGTKYIGYYGTANALVTKTTNAKAQANFDTPAIPNVN